jgi:hypothetical protein
MSRRTVSAKSLDHQVIVGWDAPLQTFFGQVFNLILPEDSEDDDLILDVERGSVAQLAEALAEYADLSSDTQQQLERDRHCPQ